MRMWSDDLSRLGQEKLAVVVKKPIERLQNLRRREVELIEHDPVAEADGLCEGAVVELQRA